MKNLILIRGVPGSGKSTYADYLLRDGLVDFKFEADQWMVDENNEYHFDPAKLPYCHGKCEQYTEEAMKAGKNVVVSNTFVKLWELDSYLDLAYRYDYNTIIYRMKNVYGSVHNVPPANIIRMQKDFEDHEREVFVI